jgi:hypothetical protein
MSTADEIRVAREEAQLALYKEITRRAAAATSPASLGRLAEAWAWATSPNQPHGAGEAA